MVENLKKIIKNAYTPYSKFNVACILIMTNNQEFIGVNVENASYKNGLCAEQVAVASAIADGYKKEDFKEIHVMGSSKEICKPCFLCRELLVEFFSEEANVYCYNKNGKCEVFKVKDLCPHPFVLEEKHD
ncbi:MAG: cytidine deaminase [bacterium]|nr:cytidine deaminase [bacterium]